MQHLTPVGLSPDGKEIVLTSNAGEEFAVPVDRLRAALRGDHARLGQLEMKMESALRPRDIQARIRSGESAEDVATAAQTTVEAIMPFAAPVLAERAHVAQTAVKCSIRRASADSSPVGRTLDEASRQHFATIAVRADDVEWDAWRREDGRWHLVARYDAQGESQLAEFTYDQPGRYVVADNEAARLLTGEIAPAVAADPNARRLSSVPTSNGDELPLGDDALELVRERDAERERERVYDAAEDSAEPEDESAVSTTDLTETAAALRAPDPRASDRPVYDDPVLDPELDAALDPAADHADADWIATVPEPHHEQAAEDESAAEQTEPGQDPPPRKKGRSSVPSWDEIMFGGGKND